MEKKDKYPCASCAYSYTIGAWNPNAYLFCLKQHRDHPGNCPDYAPDRYALEENEHETKD